MRTIIYVDGESHFIRTQAEARKKLGSDVTLDRVGTSVKGLGSVAFPDSHLPTVLCNPQARFFWDKSYPLHIPSLFGSCRIVNAIYFTAASGDEEIMHKTSVSLRSYGFEPRVVKERSQLSNQRANRLSQDGILEKAKGVDIGLAARILEDAYHENFDACVMFTSDIDFMPVVRILQRMGKKAFVCGYSDGVSLRSEFEHAADAFIDLGILVRNSYLLKPPQD